MQIRASKRLIGGDAALRRTHLVVREDQITATGLHIEACPKPVQCNGRALDVPSRPSGADHGLPAGLALPCVSPNQAVQGCFLAQPIRITAPLGKERNSFLLGEMGQ